MASFKDVFDEKKALSGRTGLKRKPADQEEEEEDLEAAEHGDERRSLPQKESDRIERLRRKMDEGDKEKSAKRSREGYVMQCPFCETTQGITCVDGGAGAVQNCSKCDLSYRAVQ
jgi:hypothetical protein